MFVQYVHVLMRVRPPPSCLIHNLQCMLCSSTAASDPSINFQEDDSSKEKDPLNSFHEEDPFFPESDITVGHFSIIDGQSQWKKVLLILTSLNLQRREFGKGCRACRGGESNCSCTWVWSERQNDEIQVRCDPSFGNRCKE